MSGNSRATILMALVLCPVFTASVGTRATRQRRSTDKDETLIQINSRDKQRQFQTINEKQRGKRSLSIAIAALIKTAKPLFGDKYYRLYEKPGGFIQALDDFDLLHPTNVARKGVTSKTGNVGDTKVMLQESFGRFTLSIWEPIQHGDSKKYLLTDIHYTK